MSRPERKLDVVLEGPAADGRLSVDYLATLAKELQSTLRRLARNRRVSAGRFGREIEQACQLDLVSFSPGSVHLGFALSDDAPPTLLPDLGEESLERLVWSLQRGEAGEASWEADLPDAVLDGIDRITRLLTDGITSIRFQTHGVRGCSVAVTHILRDRLKAARALPRAPDIVRVTGVIWEADWKDHTAELHEADGNVVRISFEADRDEDITEARKCRVAVSGVGQISGGRVRSLTLERLEIIDPAPVAQPEGATGFWEAQSIAQLAEQQQVQPVTGIDDLAGEWPADESLDEFLNMVHQGRD